MTPLCFIEPIDARQLVEVSNGLARAIKRRLNFIHLPVPLSRTDDAYFAPLADLKLGAETELYLGLIHATDGVEGTRKRIETARRYVKDFGYATECGISRARKPEMVRSLLSVYRDVCCEPSQ